MSANIAPQIADRLRQAREALGLTLEQAARDAGFNNYQTLLNIEKGERSVKVTELVRFARLYGRSLDFFLTPGTASPEPAVRWRSCADAPARLKAERRFIQFCEDYSRLEEHAQVRPAALPPVCAAPPATFAEAEDLARNTHKVMELGSRPGPALREVLEEQYGVKMLIEYTDGGSAACTKGGYGMGILINAADVPWRRNYDIAHELYHLLTWDVVPATQPEVGEAKSHDEKLADCFASALLLPAESVRSDFGRRVHDNGLPFADVVAMAREFGVSTRALLWRLVNLNLASKTSVEQALQSDSLKHADRTERRKDRSQWEARPSKRLVSLAFECLQNGTLSRGRFAEIMGIRRGEVRAFLADYGFDETGDYSGQVSTA